MCRGGFFGSILRNGNEHGVLVARARMKKFGDEAGPTGLVRGADATAGVAVEILVEKHEVLEVRVAGKLGMVFQHGAFAGFVLEEYFREAAREFGGDLLDRDEHAGSGGTLDLEVSP